MGSTVYSNARFEGNKDFILVTYNGPSYAKNVSSPTGVLNQKYDQQYYGYYTKGARFYVHKKDVRARPDLFTGVEEMPPEEEPTPEVQVNPEKPSKPPVIDNEPEGVTDDSDEDELTDPADEPSDVEVKELKPASKSKTTRNK